MDLLGCRYVLPAIAVGIVCACASAADSLPTPDDEQVVVADQILLVNTRRFPCRVGRVLNFATFRATELSANGSRTPNQLPLISEDTFPATWIFVHGNQIPEQEAIRRGLMVYRRLRPRSTTSSPVRFVIWSWPSVRDSGRLRDAREKATRTDVESFLLGSYLAKTANSGSTSLIGYSFGARIVIGAVHLAAGGNLAGYRLGDLPATLTPLRVSLLAAAVENNGLLPGGRYARACQHIDRLLLMNNSRDRALNFFWVIDPQHKPKALGDTGIRSACVSCQVQQYDWAKSIGHEHSLFEYLNRPAVMSRVANHISQ